MTTIAYNRLIMGDPTASTMLAEGHALEDIVATLAAEKAALQKRVDALERIAPRRVETPDGDVAIWRCNDEDIPVEGVL